MTPFFIGIAGGSGFGKTTISYALKQQYGNRASVFHLDNYQRLNGNIPFMHGMKNLDHPRSVRWDAFLKDLSELKRKRTVTITSYDQKTLTKFKRLSFQPTDIIFVEGYLLLHNPKVRKLLDFCVFLAARDAMRVKRRTKFKNVSYVKKILIPMHHKYVEPTKQFADLILDTEKYSIKQCVEKIKQSLESLRNRF